ALGPVVIAGLVLVLAAWPARRTVTRTTAITARARGRRPPSAVAASFARTGLPEPAVVGVRFAFERGEGDGAVPVRMALVGGTIAIAALVGAATFALSANRLLDTPRLYGWNWQVRAGSPALPDIGNLVAPALAGDPD